MRPNAGLLEWFPGDPRRVEAPSGGPMLSELQLQPLGRRSAAAAAAPSSDEVASMKPMLLQAAQGAGGLAAGSPPALSPNLPSVVKVEPRLPSPCIGGAASDGGPAPSKRVRQDDAGAWISSPSSQMSVGSLSPPPPLLNGLANSSGLSPVSCSSYETYSPRGPCKEEMSPSSGGGGMNGYFVDSFGDPKKKKGPAPRQQEELCLVCGDRASGYHYNALTCEGCKGFFRRSITKNAVYQCKYGNNCDIDMYMRRKCQECRLKKCLSVGMRPECVVPEYQCAIKRESKKHQKDRPNSTTRESPSGLMAPSSVGGGVSPSSQPLGGGGSSLGSNSNHEEDKKPLVLSPGVKPLTSSQEDLINKLVYYQQEFESPSEEDMKKTTPFPLGDSEEDNQRRFQHITEITILTVQLIVEFSKRVPGFDTLAREDQITLLKACSSEVMMLRGARKYDVKTDSIVFANNQPYTRDNYRSASVGDSADALFRFCRKMCQLRVDNAEYALLTAIVIFSERPALVDPCKVERIQEYYIETLRMYSENHRPPGKNYFARLLSILTELRTLGNMNAEMCFSLKVQNKKLPPFLAEIWDIQE
ncbi:ecdysone receptor-like isoform X1 [Dermacentor variabilis]|uniref:ecdysone receptor-like isoform X1 n=1 Tax=Dermacentor variabilis TaxID=34621 RepID=UPI003F5B5A2A